MSGVLSAGGRQNPTGRIEVVVRDSLTGQAVPGAEVSLGLNQAPDRNIVTIGFADGTGRAVFTGLRSGSYEVQARHEAYIGGRFGEAVVLGAEDPAQLVELRLPGGATLAGRVVDQEGNPLPGVRVAANRVGYALGRAILAGAPQQVTNDRGEFRLTRVRAGEHYLSVEVGSPEILADGYPRASWYPGVLRFTEAAPVIVRGGDQLAGLELRLPLAETYSISGTILNLAPGGRPLGDGSVSRQVASMYIGPADPASPETIYRVGTRPDGAPPGDPTADMTPFRIDGLVPGAWYLYPIFRTGEGITGTTRRTRVDIVDRDMENLEIVLLPHPDVTGGLVVEDGPERIDWSAVRVAMRPRHYVPYFNGLVAASTAVDPETLGFILPAVEAGRYSVVVSGLPPDAYVSSLELGARTLTDGIVEVTYGLRAPIRVTISMGGASVSGWVRNSRGDPAPAAGVALVPDAPRRNGAHLYRRAVADAQGRYVLAGVAPGSYRVFAWPALPEGQAEESARFLGRYETYGQSVTVSAPNHAVDLRLIE